MSSQEKPAHALPVTEMVRNQTGDFVVAVEQLETQRDELLAALEGLQRAIHDAHLLDIKKHRDICGWDAVANTAIHNVRGGN